MVPAICISFIFTYPIYPMPVIVFLIWERFVGLNDSSYTKKL